MFGLLYWPDVVIVMFSCVLMGLLCKPDVFIGLLYWEGEVYVYEQSLNDPQAQI